MVLDEVNSIFLIGGDAFIEKVQVEGRDAEYVRGDWRQAFADGRSQEEKPGADSWVWDSEAPSQRLRWQEGQVLFAIHYRSNPEEVMQSLYLTKEDLVTIAENMAVLSRASTSGTIYITYTVQEGNTCTAIANRYATTIGTLIRLNGLSDTCLVFTGQTLVVPLLGASVPLGEIDLNCDGQPERVQVIPNPDDPSLETVFGVILGTLSKIGLFQEVWSFTVADLSAAAISKPQIISDGSCRQLVALNIFGGELEDTVFKIFRWDDEASTMTPLID